MLDRGVQMSSDYSGWMCAEDALRFHVAAMWHCEEFTWVRPPEDTIDLHRACDNDEMVQHLIASRPGSSRPKKLFMDVNDRLPDWARVRLDRMEVANGINEYTHSLQGDFIMNHRAVIFNSSAKSPDKFQSGDAPENVWSEEQCINSDAYLSHAHCVAGHPKAGRRLQGHVAGTPCLGHSPRGGRAGDAHPSAKGYNIWLGERRSMAESYAEDFFFFENAACFPSEEKLARPLAASHHVRSIRLSPECTGWPTSRERTFSFAINSKTMAWRGPVDFEEEFRSLFARVLTRVTADDFLIESRGGLLRDLRERALRRGVHLQDDLDLDTTDFTKILTAGQLSRLRALEACKGEGQSIAGPDRDLRSYVLDVVTCHATCMRLV